MISAVKESISPLTPILGPSQWINIKDFSPESTEHTSEAEFKELLNMLKQVISKENNSTLLESIYIITFYKQFNTYIKNNLLKAFRNTDMQNRIKQFCQKKVGTIHAFQGKENNAVIMLLGARNLMTEKPNVLNVGISRAKQNIYIIGNQSLWCKHPHMATIYEMLECHKLLRS